MKNLLAIALAALVGSSIVGCAHKKAAKLESTPAAAPAAAEPASEPTSRPPPN